MFSVVSSMNWNSHTPKRVTRTYWVFVLYRISGFFSTFITHKGFIKPIVLRHRDKPRKCNLITKQGEGERLCSMKDAGQMASMGQLPVENHCCQRTFANENVSMIVKTLEKLKRCWMTQQDNHPKHTSTSTSEWLKYQNQPKVSEWPGQSLDFSPIEMLWCDLKRAVHAIELSNVAEPVKSERSPQWCQRLTSNHC